MKERSEIAAAKVRFASENTVADMLTSYHERVFSDRNFDDMRFCLQADEAFEQAVFEKNSPYLRLLLLKSVTSPDVATKLWKWADQTNELTYEEGLAAKTLLLEGAAAYGVLVEGDYGESNPNGQIGVVQSLAKGDEGPLFSVFKNPWLRRLVSQVLLKKGVFESLDEKLFPRLLYSLAFYPALNYDDSNEHGPDLCFWDLRKGIEKWLTYAPASSEWFGSIELLLTKMEPEMFGFWDFKSSEFIEKWKRFDSKDEDVGYDRIFTKTAGEYLSVLFAAKFGSDLIRDKKITIKAALAMQSSPLKAAYFGRTSFKEVELKKILEQASMDVREYLLYNPTALLIPSIRRTLMEYAEDDPTLVSRLAFLSKKYPRYFDDDLSISNGKDSALSLSKAIDQRLLLLEKKIAENTRLIWMLGAFVVLLLTYGKP